MEVLHTPPDTSTFIPLEEHQSHTPESFYSGPPVLHHFSEKCKIVISDNDLSRCSALHGFRSQATATGAANGAAGEAAGAEEGADEKKDVVIDGVDVWVTSERLLLYSSSATSGVAVRYPTISLHATHSLQLPSADGSTTVQGLYMQLANDTQESASEDDDMDSISLTLVPREPEPQAQAEPEPSEEPLATDENKPTQTPTQALFTALSACSNLHPDPTADDDNEAGAAPQIGGSVLFQNGLIAPGSSDGGLPPAMPGSGGWITAENMHEYFDEEGNWIGGGEEPGSLGPGAGTVRRRDEEGEGGEEGCEEGSDETKWRRTE